MNPNVGMLRIFPGITTATVDSFLQARAIIAHLRASSRFVAYLLSTHAIPIPQPPMEGVVIQTYGSGNAPDSREDLLEVFRQATKRGVLMVNCTQCMKGFVTDAYRAGRVCFHSLFVFSQHLFSPLIHDMSCPAEHRSCRRRA